MEPFLPPENTERLETCLFWKLPLEIRDMIYDHVYGGDGTVKVVAREGWEWREKFQRSLYPTRRPFPNSALSSMLVSKLYLSEASRRYVDANVFFFEDTWALQDAVEEGCPINRQVIRLIRSARISIIYREDGLDRLAVLPNLTKLEICIVHRILALADKPEADQSSDLDLVNRLMVAGLRKLRGLKQVKVKEIDLSSHEAVAASHRVQSSLDRIEQGLTKIITQPKAAQDVTDHVQSVWDLLTSRSLPSSQTLAKAPKS